MPALEQAGNEAKTFACAGQSICHNTFPTESCGFFALVTVSGCNIASSVHMTLLQMYQMAGPFPEELII